MRILKNLFTSVVLLILCFSFSCSKPSVELKSAVFEAKDLSYQIEHLKDMNEEELLFYQHRPKNKRRFDRILRLSGQDCSVKQCRFAELTLWIKNNSSQAIAPPVVKLSSNHDGEQRGPISITALQIDAHKRARLRVIIELWPDESELKLEISRSVFMQISDGNLTESGEFFKNNNRNQQIEK